MARHESFVADQDSGRIQGILDGDGTADFALWLTGQIGLVAGDFVL
jgi:hypothetical protein